MTEAKDMVGDRRELQPTPSDRPIRHQSEDILERSHFVERLASALIDSKTNRSTGVVVGISGPWGSGKTSILNLLHEHIANTHRDALVIRFDPWLVSGRDDLIAEFLLEVIGTININHENVRKFKEIASSLADYGARLSSFGDILLPGTGGLASSIFNTVKFALSGSKSLGAIRNKLFIELNAAAAPIVVMIDEIDRVEDGEVRTIAQLVRSVADFPSISYVLAYDADRVVQALGSGSRAKERVQRGRDYLEKIVQFQIPIPVTFDAEIERLVTTELVELSDQLGIADSIDGNRRYRDLLSILAGDLIRTPRDIRRLISKFRVIAAMLHDEVDWVDLLGYSALLAKAPMTVLRMHREPDQYLENPMSSRSVARFMARNNANLEERLAELIPNSELNDGTKNLLGFLFPSLASTAHRQPEHADAFCERRPFLTTLRLGLLTGEFSKAQIESLMLAPNEQIILQQLRQAHDDGGIFKLLDRLDDTYAELSPSIDARMFWGAVGEFLKKPNCEWMSSYQRMNEIVRGFADIAERAVGRSSVLRQGMADVFMHLKSAGESELTAHWLRSHLYTHGLFGNENRGGERWFFAADFAEKLAYEMALGWRSDHMSERLIPCRWDIQPIYTMIDTGVWDDECRRVVDEMLTDDRALDGLTLMLFGGVYATSVSTLRRICDYESYIRRVRSRLESETISQTHKTARVALEKARDENWL
jgi:hypothetical protein